MTQSQPPKLNMPENWQPPVPSFSSAIAPDAQLVIAYLACQATSRATARCGFDTLMRFADGSEPGPFLVDRSFRQAAAGFWEYVAVAYFISATAFDDWAGRSGFDRWWNEPARLSDGMGYWQERLSLPARRIEALHSSYNKDGHSHGGELVGPIRHHAYWGAMRDRLPASRDDLLPAPLERRTRADVASVGQRIVVTPPLNLAIIRSGHDRAHASEQEIALYDEIVRETLLDGMRYLETEGEDVGCYACRYLTEVDAGDRDLQRNFGHCLFHSLADLEDWAKSHPTHLAIFGSFFKLQKLCDNQMTLRFWHEVAVLPATGQHFEYINCHPQTGLIGYFAA